MTIFVDNGNLLVPQEQGPAKLNVKYRPKYLELDDEKDRAELDALLSRLYAKYSPHGGIVVPVQRMQSIIIETFAKTMLGEDWSCETLT